MLKYKRRHTSLTIVVISFLLILTSVSAAEELKYKPTNPAFGGNPFNGPYLLSNATAQRQHEAPIRRRDPLEEFSDTVKRGLLSRIAREIADQILGEDAKDSGTFEIGDLKIDFKQVNDQVVIDINDQAAGGKTQIELPMPSY